MDDFLLALLLVAVAGAVYAAAVLALVGFLICIAVVTIIGVVTSVVQIIAACRQRKAENSNPSRVGDRLP